MLAWLSQTCFVIQNLLEDLQLGFREQRPQRSRQCSLIAGKGLHKPLERIAVSHTLATTARTSPSRVSLLRFPTGGSQASCARKYPQG